MYKNLTLSLLTILSINLSAQNYFQQEVNHNIDVKLNDKNHTLIAEQIIEYTNNSPNDLDFLWFHIWPNAYKDNSTALAKHELESGNTDLYYATEEERGYITDLNFTINGKKVDLKYHPEHIDICKLILNKPIKAGETITIKTPFKVKIPDARFSRLGHVDQSYMITQWYPKPAVYDKDGWHIMPYLSQGEFYSEFGSFDVSITLPRNYTVGATGDLQNKGEHFRLDELAEITDTISRFGSDMNFPESNKKTKTIRFTQEKVHDFGWFADKRYHVLKGKVELPYSGRTVTLYTMFTNNEAHLWKNSIEYMHDAVYYYSLWNGDYPYNYCTAVDGTIAAGGGMEYPNVTVIGESGSPKMLEEVIMHEVGHNWFYGILGSNERDHAWMDEGINSYNEQRYMMTKYPEYNMLDEMIPIPNKLKKVFDLENITTKNVVGELLYLIGAWTAKDQPIDFPSANYTSMNYGGIVYMKTYIVFDYLSAYLGQDMFDNCMKEYFEKWKYKHPQPEDLKAIFEDKTGKDLSWFFNNMITTTNQLDYSISKIDKGPENLHITLKNNGTISGPIVICGVKDGVVSEELWLDGFEGTKTITYINGDYDHIQIDYNGVMPETNRNNNIYKTKGLFKQCEPIKLQLIGSVYNREKTQIFYHPNLSWNKYNQFSAGLSIYNKFIPQGGISYKLSPMYSFGTKGGVGKGNISFTKYSHSFIFSKAKLSLDAEKFDWNYNKIYKRFSPSIDLTLSKSSLRDKKDHYLKASYIYLEKNDGKGELEFIKGNYTFSNARTLNPYSLHLKLEKGGEFTKANLIMNYNYHLNQKKRLMIRGYLGYVNNQNSTYDLQMSAWDGSMDYTFSEKSYARSETEGTLSKQLFIREGGLKHYTDITSDNFLASLSLDYKLLKILDIYAEAGTNGDKYAYGTGFLFQTGGLGIYLPIYTENGLFSGRKYHEGIRLQINANINISGFGF